MYNQEARPCETKNVIRPTLFKTELLALLGRIRRRDSTTEFCTGPRALPFLLLHNHNFSCTMTRLAGLQYFQINIPAPQGGGRGGASTLQLQYLTCLCALTHHVRNASHPTIVGLVSELSNVNAALSDFDDSPLRLRGRIQYKEKKPDSVRPRVQYRNTCARLPVQLQCSTRRSS